MRWLRLNVDARCLSPPLNSTAYSYDITVVVVGVPTSFQASQWNYDDPVITSLQPQPLPPSLQLDAQATQVGATPQGPRTPVVLHVTGANFGGVPGWVAAGPRTLRCVNWTDAGTVCGAPPGVMASVLVTVIAATVRRSASAVLAYAAPTIASMTLTGPGSTIATQGTPLEPVFMYGTEGGGLLIVEGVAGSRGIEP